MKLIIREAKISDLDVLLSFEQDLIEFERPFDETIDDGHVNYYDLSELINSDTVHLAVVEMNSQVIGSGYIRIKNAESFRRNQHYGYIGFMYVVPDYRGKGVAKQIINYLIAWAKKKQVHDICLEVYENNTSALAAYEKAGFVKQVSWMRYQRKTKSNKA